MRDPSTHVRPKNWPGVLLLAGGAGFAALSRHPEAQVISDLQGYAGPTVQAAAGAAIAVVGVARLAWSLTRADPPQARVSAHEAFSSRQKRTVRVEDVGADPAQGRPRYAPKARRAAGASAAQADPTAALDQEIKAIEMKIRRAKVMYGTGKLSEDGYAKYVDGLKKDLATLEAQRVTTSLGGTRATTAKSSGARFRS